MAKLTKVNWMDFADLITDEEVENLISMCDEIGHDAKKAGAPVAENREYSFGKGVLFARLDTAIREKTEALKKAELVQGDATKQGGTTLAPQSAADKFAAIIADMVAKGASPEAIQAVSQTYAVLGGNASEPALATTDTSQHKARAIRRNKAG